MHGLNRQYSILGFTLLGFMALSGCASKKFVRTHVSTLEPSIEEANKANMETSERIDTVDRRAQEGIAAVASAATAADKKATDAAEAAVAANTSALAADRKAETATQAVQQVNNRTSSLEARISSIDTYTVGEPQAIVFKTNSSVLSDEAKQSLDSIASSVSGQQSGYLIEIQGFTDARGSDDYNTSLSQRRAERALRYLVGKGLPLHRISLVGLGEDRPVADNKFPRGREQNRRVEIRVLRAASNRSTN